MGYLLNLFYYLRGSEGNTTIIAQVKTMGTTDNNKPTAVPAAKLTKEERLAQAREYAKQFKFDTLSEEDLIRIRRNAYKYAI